LAQWPCARAFSPPNSPASSRNPRLENLMLSPSELIHAAQNLTIAQSWALCNKLPFGKQAFSKLISLRVPYSGAMGAEVVELADGHAVVTLRDRRAVRNHLNCIHAIALMNLGELCTGLATFHKLDGFARGIVTELRIQYYKKSRGTITARCDLTIPTQPGRHDLTVQGNLFDAAGDKVATVWATWQIEIPL
jgi:acyl-coenzyme A thioesterase PaaI-like protein